MSNFFHQRTHSQAQQLIPQRGQDPEDPSCSSPFGGASPYGSDPVQSHPPPSGDDPSSSSSHPAHPSFAYRTSTGGDSMLGAIRFSTLSSDCSSSYYRLPGGMELPPVTSRNVLRANLRVVLGSMALALLGTVLLFFGICVMVFPNDMDVHGWIFLVVGVLFAIPGFYHVWYIGCTLCGRPGYSFEQLPTFTKPARLY